MANTVDSTEAGQAEIDNRHFDCRVARQDFNHPGKRARLLDTDASPDPLQKRHQALATKNALVRDQKAMFHASSPHRMTMRDPVRRWSPSYRIDALLTFHWNFRRI